MSDPNRPNEPVDPPAANRQVPSATPAPGTPPPDEPSSLPPTPPPTSPPTEPPTTSPPTEPPTMPPSPPVAPPPPGAYSNGQQYGAAAPAKAPVLSIISLIAGIIGVLGFAIVFIPFIGSIMELFIPAAAVVLGFLGRAKERSAKGLWLTGIILGFVGLAIAVVSLILWIVFAAAFSNSGYTY